MNRTKNFLYNSATTAVYQIVVMIVGFVIPRVMLTCYGSEINGLVSSINQFILYFNIVEAGLAGSSIYALYKPLADKNQKEISGIVSASKKLYIQSGYIFSCLVILLSVLYPVFIKTNNLSSASISVLVIILGSKGFLEFFTLSKYRVILTADQKTYIVSIASSVYVILNMIIIVILSYLGSNIVIVYAFALVALFSRTLILMIYTKVKYSYIDYKAEPNLKALNKRWDALFLNILQAVQTGAPVVLVTVFLSLKEVSVFSIYNMVIAGINGVLSIFISGLSASFGNVIAKDEIETLQKTYQEFEFSYYIVITIVYTIAIVLITPFVLIYTKDITDINYNEPLIGFFIVLNGWLYNLKTPQGMLVISAGHFKETRYRSLIQAIILLAAGIALAYKFGIIGILIASCLSNLYRDIDLMFYVPKYITKLHWFSSGKRMLWSLVMFFIISGVVNTTLDIKVAGYLLWLKYACIIGVFTLVIVIFSAYVIDSKQVVGVIKRMKAIVIKQ